MIAELRQRGFVEVPRVRQPWAVYALLRGEEVVYVGQSKSIYDRLAAHYVASGRPDPKVALLSPGDTRAMAIKFDRTMVFFCQKDELLKLEMELINRYRPKHNVQVRKPLPNVKIDVVALAREVGIEFRKPPSSGIFRRRVA